MRHPWTSLFSRQAPEARSCTQTRANSKLATGLVLGGGTIPSTLGLEFGTPIQRRNPGREQTPGGHRLPQTESTLGLDKHRCESQVDAARGLRLTHRNTGQTCLSIRGYNPVECSGRWHNYIEVEDNFPTYLCLGDTSPNCTCATNAEPMCLRLSWKCRNVGAQLQRNSLRKATTMQVKVKVIKKKKKKKEQWTSVLSLMWI